jgi:simple sugar transport system ATP-binding protein
MTEATESLIQNSKSKLQYSEPPPELEVVSMTKQFGTFTALDNVSLHLKTGNFSCLAGGKWGGEKYPS